MPHNDYMFFRRHTPRVVPFRERVETLKQFGFSIEFRGSSSALVTRGCIGAVVEDRPDRPHVNKAGLFLGGEIGLLVNHGYQMFWETPSGKRMPAQASQLRELHEFQEDLKEGLGLTSLYNEGLGTTSDLHNYDRVEDRDHSGPKKPWEKVTTLT